MTSDEIMQVLRLTAMSRVNHPDQQRFCDKLSELFSGWVAPKSEWEPLCRCNAQTGKILATPVADLEPEAPKRGPGRPKKAE